MGNGLDSSSFGGQSKQKELSMHGMGSDKSVDGKNKGNSPMNWKFILDASYRVMSHCYAQVGSHHHRRESFQASEQVPARNHQH